MQEIRDFGLFICIQFGFLWIILIVIITKIQIKDIKNFFSFKNNMSSPTHML